MAAAFAPMVFTKHSKSDFVFGLAITLADALMLLGEFRYTGTATHTGLWCVAVLQLSKRIRKRRNDLKNWRTRRDSNARPLPSEQFNLPFDAFR